MNCRGVVIGVSLFLAGCVSMPPQPTREQWLDLKTRTYPGVTQAQVFAAAERLFTLADGSDFSFVYAPTGDQLTAVRRWMLVGIIPVWGRDTWTVTATPQDGRVLATVEALRNEGETTPQVYRLFWARMDYLLGRSKTWITCDKAWEGKGNREYAALQMLCEFVADDVPAGAITGR
jgi:hypothetical protein